MRKIGRESYKLRITDRVLDNIHGHIGLTKVENEIEHLPIFKRLHNISQLGLANRIFPGAVHSRYSHSLGVMKVASMMADSINSRNPSPFFDESDVQLIRLAGLLHDIGHYPLSHNIEHAYRTHFAANSCTLKEKLHDYVNCPENLNPFISTDIDPDKIRDKNRSDFIEKYSGSKNFHHENVGYQIIKQDEGIREVIKKNFILLSEDNEEVVNKKFQWGDQELYSDEDINEITDIVLYFIGNVIIGNYSFDENGAGQWCSKYSAIVQLIHSELDADNIDYLMRDASFSGTTYGLMDMTMLINSLSVIEIGYDYSDNGSNFRGKRYIVGVLPKGIGNVEQFLINKYLAYSQVIYSKYVVILEAMLLHIVRPLLSSKAFDYPAESFISTINAKNDEYLKFTDSFFMYKICNEQLKNSAILKEIYKRIVERLHNNMAFYLDKTVEDPECLCSSSNEDKLKTMVKKHKVYKEFAKLCNNIGDTKLSELSSEDEIKLFSYQFASYKLTKQIPKNIFFNKHINSLDRKKEESLKFQYLFYRLADGVPIIEKGNPICYTINSKTRDFPDLIVDSDRSFLRDIYKLEFVFLRKYSIAEMK